MPTCSAPPAAWASRGSFPNAAIALIGAAGRTTGSRSKTARIRQRAKIKSPARAGSARHGYVCKWPTSGPPEAMQAKSAADPERKWLQPSAVAVNELFGNTSLLSRR